jgi:murein DD-endopeptidase MepM/ murein hydrolase activator NlpD
MQSDKYSFVNTKRIIVILLLMFMINFFIIGCQGSDPTMTPSAVVTQPLKTSPVPTLTMTPTVKEPTPSFTTTLSDEPTETIEPTEVQPFIMCSPLEGEEIEGLSEIVSDPYDPPPMGKDDRHQGVDLSYYRRGDRLTIQGVEIYAILSGKVISVINDRLPYGNMIMIETSAKELPDNLSQNIGLSPGESIYHLYAHLEEVPPYAIGDYIECGMRLGTVGTTGYNIVNPHLHLEARIGPSGEIFSSMTYYDTMASEVEMRNYERWRMSGEFSHFDPMHLFSIYLALE